jgi:signal transduction histidine kinase
MKWKALSGLYLTTLLNYFVAVFDNINKRKQTECRQALSAEIHGILNDPTDMDDAVNRIITAIKRDMSFDAVGIRLHHGDDFPYVAQDGFSKEFLIEENTLAVRNQNGGVCMDKDGTISLECTCGLVISGQTDPANPIFTQRGSFWTNESFILLDLPIDQDPRLHPRNRCIHEGFHSVALIPLKAGYQIIGILQLNDRLPDQFTPELISYFEDLGAVIGIAFSRKQAEDELKKAKRLSDALNLELEVANEYLEAFSYSVSHDLRAPLRHMTGFAKLLQKRMEGQKDEKSRQYALLISDASSKMERLIDDLLSYSRLGREEMPKREVKLSDLLKESIDEISEGAKGRAIAWKIGELPTVYCEPSMLKLVLVNFISNALKFTSIRPKAEIEIDCNKSDSEVVCFVKDNGAGFDMKQVDRLFGVFQRLHTQNEFAGIGIGLANVRRIIALHGGRTWAEGAVGQGATFYFSLPLPKGLIPNLLPSENHSPQR